MPQNRPVHGEIYRHFKNKFYQVVDIAVHSETGEKLVIYQALYGDFQVYARPYDMFISEVDHDKYPEVTATYRFTLIKGVGPVVAAGEDTESSGRASDEVASEEKSTEKKGSSDTAEQEEVKEQEVLSESEQEPSDIHPKLLAFLDADSISDKYHIVKNMSYTEVTNSMVDTMAVSLDVVINEGDVEDRLLQLRSILRTRGQYELSRFRP